MTQKPNTRSWYDVQMTIAAISMSGMLMLWNLFAGPDRQEAERKVIEETQLAVVPPAETPVLAITPTPITKIFFTNASTLPSPSAPQQQSKGKTKKNRDGGGGGGKGGGGGGGGGGGSTGSS